MTRLEDGPVRRRADSLDHQVRTGAGVGRRLAARLIELGHGEQVRRQAGRGDWACAHEWARFLAGAGRFAEAAEVLAPYVATGWWNAVRAMAELLEQGGRVDEAIALTQPRERSQLDFVARLQVDFVARLLARHGRAEEAFALLRPYIEDWFLAVALVDVAERGGLDEAAAALLAERIEAERHRPGWKRGNSVGLLAAIRERQGRVDEAIALLRTRENVSVNGRDQLADLLARHDRIAELRAYDGVEAMRRLAEVLEERGDVEGAIAVFRQAGDSVRREVGAATLLASLLTRHGRGDEATRVLRALADSRRSDDGIAEMLCAHYADQGRPEDGLTWLDARGEEEDWTFFRMRLELMAAGGRLDEALEQAQAHPEAATWYASLSVAALQAAAGRIDDAVATLQQQPDRDSVSQVLVEHLIDLGRINEAVALLQIPTDPPGR